MASPYHLAMAPLLIVLGIVGFYFLLIRAISEGIKYGMRKARHEERLENGLIKPGERFKKSTDRPKRTEG